MKNLSMLGSVFFLACICFEVAWAGVDTPWSTTFNCPEWEQADGLSSDAVNCDGLRGYGGWLAGTTGEQITNAANFPEGAGGRGQRHWIGTDRNDVSGGLSVNFNKPQTEFWMRFYIRFQEGITFRGLKMLYVYMGGGSGYVNFPYGNDKIRFYEQSGGDKSLECSGCGWNSLYNGGPSDGRWIQVEVHFKKNTAGANGVFQLWLDGKLKIDRRDADFGPGAFTNITLGSNGSGHSGSGPAYLDFDDFAISNSGYIGGIKDGGTPPPPPPQARPQKVKNLKVLPGG